MSNLPDSELVKRKLASMSWSITIEHGILVLIVKAQDELEMCVAGDREPSTWQSLGRLLTHIDESIAKFDHVFEWNTVPGMERVHERLAAGKQVPLSKVKGFQDELWAIHTFFTKLLNQLEKWVREGSM